MPLFRHGDVLVQSAEALPDDAVRHSGSTLAHGEVTGHSHRFAPPDAGELFLHGAALFLRAHRPVTLTHEEHGPIELQPGLYRVWRQREYTPEAIRIVVD